MQTSISQSSKQLTSITWNLDEWALISQTSAVIVMIDKPNLTSMLRQNPNFALLRPMNPLCKNSDFWPRLLESFLVKIFTSSNFSLVTWGSSYWGWTDYTIL